MRIEYCVECEAEKGVWRECAMHKQHPSMQDASAEKKWCEKKYPHDNFRVAYRGVTDWMKVKENEDATGIQSRVSR